MAFKFTSTGKSSSQAHSSLPVARADRTRARPVHQRQSSLHSCGKKETSSTSPILAITDSRHGYNFSQVRVHPERAESARGVVGHSVWQRVLARRLIAQGHAMGGLATVQTKLKIGAPGDKYEEEADRVAEQVVGSVAGLERQDHCQQCSVGGGVEQAVPHQRSSAELPRISSLSQPMIARLRLSDLTRSEPLQVPDQEIFPEDAALIQTKPTPRPGANGAGTTVVPTDLESTILQRSNSGGEPLPVPTRAFLEPRFGHDFSRVRVHTDGPSGEISRQLNARAFTLGNHIFFAPGEYAPQHHGGQKLLAHELTHVVQQGASSGTAQAARIQRSENDSLALCPPYWRWETPRNVEMFNCSGLAHRTYDFKPLSAAKSAVSSGRSVGCGSPCNSGEVKHWLWEFDTHVEDKAGTRLSATSHDFHTVAGVSFGASPQDPTDVYSTDGRRPVHGPAPGPSFKPLAKEQAKANNATERLQTDRAGNPVFWILYNYQESCHCLPCPK